MKIGSCESFLDLTFNLQFDDGRVYILEIMITTSFTEINAIKSMPIYYWDWRLHCLTISEWRDESSVQQSKE